METITVIIEILTALVAMLLGWQFVYFIRCKIEINKKINDRIRDLDNCYRHELEHFKKDVILNAMDDTMAISIIYSWLNNENGKSFGISQSLVLADFLHKHIKIVNKSRLAHFLQTVTGYNINGDTPLEDLKDYRDMVNSFDFELESKRPLLKSMDYYIEKNRSQNKEIVTL